MAFSVVQSGLSSLTSKAGAFLNLKLPFGSNPDLQLVSLRGLNRPAPTWRWSTIFPNVLGLTIPDMHCEGLEVPLSFSSPPQERFFGGRNFQLPGITHYENITATFYENENYDTTTYFIAWQTLIYNASDNSYGIPSDYLKPIGFTFLPAVETNGTPSTSYPNTNLIVTGFPTSLPRYTYNGDTDRVKITIDFAVHALSLETFPSVPVSPGLDAGTVLNSFLKFTR